MRLLVPSIVLAVACISGCSPNSVPSAAEPPKEQSQPAGDVVLEEQYPQLKLKWIEADGKQIESTGSPVSATAASLRVVEDKFRQLDWNNPASKPSLAIELAEDRSLTMMLSPDSTGDHQEIIAVSRKPGPSNGNATTTIVRRSRPLKDAEQALQLLQSYTKDDGEFESLVEWVNQDSDSSAKGD